MSLPSFLPIYQSRCDQVLELLSIAGRLACLLLHSSIRDERTEDLIALPERGIPERAAALRQHPRSYSTCSLLGKLAVHVVAKPTVLGLRDVATRHSLDG